MTTFPLATLAAQVTSTGISAPSYADILGSLTASYQSLFGSDAYLGPDSQDGQWIAIIAQGFHDTNQTAIAAYNQFSPSTAQGTGLSSVVKTNGIRRLVPSQSTAPVTLVGQVGTTITNGLVGDNLNLGTQWAFPSTTIPLAGTITVTATCTTAGAVAAAAGTLTAILTPTRGWQTVTNASNAAPGAPVEVDPTLRQRQTSSVALPSQTVVSGIVGTLENLTGVTAVSYDENDNTTANANGTPGNTVAFVVQGGAVQDIVNAIGLKKTPGTGTAGTTSGTYIDAYGIPHTISYFVPAQQTISVAITLHALAGYSSAIGVEIQASVAAYINGLGIGGDVLLSRLQVPAQLFGPFASPASPADAATFEITLIKAAISPASPGTTDITIPFNQIAICTATNVVLTVA